MSEPRKKICVVMQPTFLPWVGYFDLIDQSDYFVFLDNVQFEKSSWQQRNRILTTKGLEWISLPVKRKFPQLICEAKIQMEDFPRKHLRAIECAYSRALFFNDLFPKLESIFNECDGSLCNLNIRVVKMLCGLIGMESQFVMASELDLPGRRSTLLGNICERLGADIYLSPAGSEGYLIEEMLEFNQRKIKVLLHNYSPAEYDQLHRPFVPYASAIDLFFNQGPKSLETIRSGRKESKVMNEEENL
ncbi:MAG: WbqC family protein [Candidatus Riflebacteria bacterium]|nr:WbqC family protein [Candidatus Riflebacteria bacterium]